MRNTWIWIAMAALSMSGIAYYFLGSSTKPVVETPAETQEKPQIQLPSFNEEERVAPAAPQVRPTMPNAPQPSPTTPTDPSNQNPQGFNPPPTTNSPSPYEPPPPNGFFEPPPGDSFLPPPSPYPGVGDGDDEYIPGAPGFDGAPPMQPPPPQVYDGEQPSYPLPQQGGDFEE
jgi:hypothetical protein